MDIRFSVTKMPFDYQMNHPDVPQVVSVGMCSYSGNELIHFGGEKDSRLFCNVLIGRFCSLASDITFFIGLNHIYKNVVTAYPFDDRGIAIDFSAWNRPYERHLIPNLRQTRDNHYQVIIGNDVWIGNGATIIGGVKIGSGAIIGTNSVVAKDIPPYAIAVGNPARVVKFRFDADTISKFLAIKWWNWDIKKILDNVPQMYCIEKFLSAHYTPGMELAPYAEIGGGAQLERYIAEGRKIYSFVADFRTVQPLWKRVISGFLKSPRKNSVLLFWLGEGATPADFENLKTFVNSVGLSEGKIIHVLPQKFSPYLLRNSTHFITTRDMVTLECLDWLYDTNVKVVSALDDGIFTDEPEVSWNELYAKS